MGIPETIEGLIIIANHRNGSASRHLYHQCLICSVEILIFIDEHMFKRRQYL
jgi:hypothetical protein